MTNKLKTIPKKKWDKVGKDVQDIIDGKVPDRDQLTFFRPDRLTDEEWKRMQNDVSSRFLDCLSARHTKRQPGPYIYSVGYGSMEDSDRFELCHHEKYSDRRFKELVLGAVIRVLRRIAAGEIGPDAEGIKCLMDGGKIVPDCRDCPKEKQEVCHKEDARVYLNIYIGKAGPTFEHLLPWVVDELIEKDGFRRLEFQARFSCFGWPSVTCRDDWRGQRGGNLDWLNRRIPKTLAKKCTTIGNRHDRKLSLEDDS